MKRSGFLPRSSSLRRGKGLSARTKAGKPRTSWRATLVFQKPKEDDFARKYHSMERVDFVCAKPCAGCGIVGFSQNAHVVKDDAKGMGRKAGYKAIAPLCGPRPSLAMPATTYEGCHELFDQRKWPFDGERVRARVIAAAADLAAEWDAMRGAA